MVLLIVIIVLAALGVGGYFLYRWISTMRKKQGETCQLDIECNSGACGRERIGEPDTCCMGGATVSHVGFDYCSKQPDGFDCSFDDQCLPGRKCTSVLGQGGVCFNPQPDNSTCTKDSDCHSGACGYPGLWATGNAVCCPSSNTKSSTCERAFFCTDEIDNGYQCRLDLQCKSHYCKGNTGCKLGNCETKSDETLTGIVTPDGISLFDIQG